MLSLLVTTTAETIGNNSIIAAEQQRGQSDHMARNATSNMTEIVLSITKTTLVLAPNSSILNRPHPPPLILAASRCSDNHCHDQNYRTRLF
jgi:hypothetical protein